jgi:hypothetical protein
MASTPGPWRLVAPPGESSRVMGADGYTTVVDLLGAMGGEDSAADARLIAAAPELAGVLGEFSALHSVRYSAGYRLVDEDELARLQGMAAALLARIAGEG